MEPALNQPGFFGAARPVVGTGLVWAALSLWLHLGGHAPSGPVFVAPRNIYYAAQAGFVVPVLLLQFWVLAAVTAAVAGIARSALTSPALARAFALPLLLLWLLPDAVAYAVVGFQGMAALVRVTAPLTAVVTFALVARSIRQVHALGLGRSVSAAFAGCLAQALLGGILLR